MAKPIITLNGLKIVIMLGMLVIILTGIRFAADIIVPFVLAGRVRKRCREDWPQVAAFAETARICLVVTMVGGFFSPSLFNFPHMTMFVVSGAIYRIAVEHAAQWQPAQELPANLRPAYA